jgi:glycosidase
MKFKSLLRKLSQTNASLACWFVIVLFSFQSCNNDENVLSNTNSISSKEGPIILSPGDAYITPATEDIVMYEINIRAFSNTHNIQGITNKLDDIKALGINTIWLMPIFPVGTVNSIGSPYCVKNYLTVNPSFGTLINLKQFVTQAHQRHISVILDWVGNHTSWDNAWISSHPDWYTHNTSGQIISPAGTTWADVADLNYDNADMRLAMIAAMRYWIDAAGIDGFRCDAADYVPFDFWQQAINSLQSGRRKQLIMLAEGARDDHFTAGFKMNWSWNYITAIKSVFSGTTSTASIFAANTSEYMAVPEGSRKLRFTTNHDESNTTIPITVYNTKNGALSASAITIFLQGVPLLYCGQEVGVASTSVYSVGTIDWTANADMLVAYQQMLAFYNNSEAARKGTVVSYPNIDIVAFTKTLGSEQLLIIANTRGSIKTFVVPTELAGTYLNVMTNTTITLSANYGLTAYRYLILKRIS